MFGKNHTREALALISKPGNFNPIKKHKDSSKVIMALKKNK